MLWNMIFSELFIVLCKCNTTKNWEETHEVFLFTHHQHKDSVFISDILISSVLLTKAFFAPVQQNIRLLQSTLQLLVI